MRALRQPCAREYFFFVGGYAHPNDRRSVLPKRITTVFGILEGILEGILAGILALPCIALRVRREEDGVGKEKKFTYCKHSYVRAFDIAKDWKVTALGAGVWVETVTEGKRSFMVAWRK